MPSQHQRVGKKGMAWMLQLLEELLFSACVTEPESSGSNQMSLIQLFTDSVWFLTSPLKNMWDGWILPCLQLQSCVFSHSKGVWVTAYVPCLHVSSELFRKAQLLLPAKARRCFPFHIHLFLYLWISQERNLPSWISCQGACCGHLCSRS